MRIAELLVWRVGRTFSIIDMILMEIDLSLASSSIKPAVSDKDPMINSLPSLATNYL